MADREVFQAQLEELAQQAREGGFNLTYKLAPVGARSAPGPFVVEFVRDGELYEARWSRRLLGNGVSKYQEEWDLSKVASSVTYFDSMANADEALLRRFSKDFSNYLMMTSTRSLCNLETGNWNVVHNWNTPNAITLEDAIPVGCSDGLLSRHPHAERIALAYAGTKDVDAVIRSQQRVTGKNDIRFFAPVEDGPVVLGLYDLRFCIVADGGYDDRSARGVEVRKKVQG